VGINISWFILGFIAGASLIIWHQVRRYDKLEQKKARERKEANKPWLNNSSRF